MGAAGAVAEPPRAKARAARAVVMTKRSLYKEREREKKKRMISKLCISIGRRTNHARGSQRWEGEKVNEPKKKNSPFKSAKNYTSNNGITKPNMTLREEIRFPDRQGNKGGKPKQHGDGIERQHRNQRCQFREFQRGDQEVNSHDHCPYRGEDDEAEFRGDVAINGEFIELVCNCFWCVCGARVRIN